MMTLEATFNTAEAVLWFALALIVTFGTRGRPDAIRRNAFLAAMVFALFGVSDLLEVLTGAWWRPWWLFALKAGCIVSLATLYARNRFLSKPAIHASSEAKHEIR